MSGDQRCPFKIYIPFEGTVWELIWAPTSIREACTTFTTSSGAMQGCPLSTFVFNFVIDVLLEISLPVSATSGVEMLPGRSLRH
ncbi:hypothetical protein CLF_103839 [Clonorchis sinensis]|uniref:Reverse transcriptase domain-containing protein n=1 Tax=Clonorchis sinensis TaxID=79923 RepID=G7YNM5_CLOSI|nr:hypothetical protein CLF_103839 [Clonorchis sinensis]